jgi:hypothetical protein
LTRSFSTHLGHRRPPHRRSHDAAGCDRDHPVQLIFVVVVPEAWVCKLTHLSSFQQWLCLDNEEQVMSGNILLPGERVFCFCPVLTHCRRLCLEQSMGLLPVTISSSSTPKAKMSVFSSTMPCMKYSGAKYLRSQSVFFFKKKRRKKRKCAYSISIMVSD